MKRTHAVAAILVIAVVAIVASFWFIHPSPGQVNGPKILNAAQAYAHDLHAHGLPVPATVALGELVTNGLVQPDDVSGFAGMEVTVSLTATGSNPQDVLMRVRLQDGSEMVALADGSVHAVAK